MTIVLPAPAAIAIRVLDREAACDLEALALGSGLPTLEDRAHLLDLLACRGVLGAFAGDQLVGCACVARDVAKPYLDTEGRRRPLPLPNAYLCGAYVRAGRRQQGVGAALYAARLHLARRWTSGAVVVELLGAGVPGSIHPGTLAGWRWYRRADFTMLGHTVDPDGGPVLGWPPPPQPTGGRA